MDKFERRQIKADAAAALEGASYRPGKLVLIHTAISSGVALLIALVSFLLDQKIAGTTGLGGMGSRAILEMVQSVLEIANLVVLLFWGIGLVRVFLSISRHQDAQPTDLLAGFRNFGPVLRGKLIQGLMLGAVAFLGCYVGMFVYTMTPMSASLYAAAEPYIIEGVMDYAALEDPAFLAAALWAMPIMLGCSLLLVIPLYYRLRLMDYILMDRPEKGAMYAMRGSKVLMRGKRWDLFKLDLSFWWFYLLELLVALVCYGDMILMLLGIDFGVYQTVAFFVFYVVALLAQMGLYTWKKPLLMATYAIYYDDAWPKREEEEPSTNLYPM